MPLNKLTTIAVGARQCIPDSACRAATRALHSFVFPDSPIVLGESTEDFNDAAARCSYKFARQPRRGVGLHLYREVWNKPWRLKTT